MLRSPAWSIASLLLLAAATAAQPPLDIGSRLELFIDDALVDELTGSARRVLHHPEPREVIYQPNGPAEGATSAYYTLLREGNLARLYFRGTGDEGASHPEFTCVAESIDGGPFTRPELGLVEFNGSTANNIIHDGVAVHNFTPFIDTRPGVPADERYKAVGGRQLYPLASADGLHWRQLSDEPVITDGAFDSQNVAFWDAARGQYVCYFRTFQEGMRHIGRATSDDFLHWSPTEQLRFNRPPEQLYTNNILPYFREPSLLIGMPARFLPQRQKLANHHSPGVSDALLMVSRDGLNFHRWAEAFLQPGPDPRNWGDRTNYPVWALEQTSPTEMSVYWWEHYRFPSLAIRRGTLRIDGFVSVQAGADGGTLLTRPFTYTGGRLQLNYATSAAGGLRVEVCDEAGAPLPGLALSAEQELFGNVIDETVVWPAGGDLAAHAGQPVRLRFHLRDADLYSFRFVE